MPEQLMCPRHGINPSTDSATTRARGQKPPAETTSVSMSFAQLVLCYSEIGTHRAHNVGFGKIFGYPKLRDLPFVKLARKVKDAYEGKHVPPNGAWAAQREGLQWFVEKGREEIYTIDSGHILVRPCPGQRYCIFDGHHRALALYILGEDKLLVKVTSLQDVREKELLEKKFRDKRVRR